MEDECITVGIKQKWALSSLFGIYWEEIRYFLYPMAQEKTRSKTDTSTYRWSSKN